MERNAETRRSLHFVPIRNREIQTCQTLDEDYVQKGDGFRVDILFGAEDTTQRIYLKAFYADHAVEVSVFQADAQIGVIDSDPRLESLAQWLDTWFDGGLFIAAVPFWDEELVLSLRLFEQMSSPFTISHIELLPLAPAENALDFIFTEPPESLRNRDMAPLREAEETRIYLLHENLCVLEFRGLLSDARHLPENALGLFPGIGSSFSIQSEISIGLENDRAVVSLNGSFRSPTKDEEVLSRLSTFKIASPNFSAEFYDLT